MSQHCIVCGKLTRDDYIEVGIYAGHDSTKPEVTRRACSDPCAIKAADGAQTVTYAQHGAQWMRDVEASAKPSPIFDGLLTR